MRSATATLRVIWACRAFPGYIVPTGDHRRHVMHGNTPGRLTAHEFDAMMRELDEAQDWMLDQLKQRRVVQEQLHVPSETDQ